MRRCSVNTFLNLKQSCDWSLAHSFTLKLATTEERYFLFRFLSVKSNRPKEVNWLEEKKK